MNLCHIFDSLFDPLPGAERSPSLSVFRPGIACQQDPPARLPAVFRVKNIAHGEIGNRPTSGDALILLPGPPPALEEYFGLGIVVELAHGALFQPGERLEHLEMAQHGRWDGEDRKITLNFFPPGRRTVMNGDFFRGLVDGDHPGTKADAVL